jgi:hypothetical protein
MIVNALLGGMIANGVLGGMITKDVLGGINGETDRTSQLCFSENIFYCPKRATCFVVF